MDVDICGPSLPLLFGMQGQRLHSTSSGILPLSITSALSLVSIGFLLPSSNSAVIWRGPKKNGLIKQFLKDVEWGQLENLVIDTPPGTSDEHLSIVQYLAAAGGVDGAVIVTTPQEVALQDVRKELDFCAKVGVPVLGVVENMSGFVCPSCGGESDIFIPSTGGALGLAEEWGIEVLGKVPLDPRIGKSGDYGQSFLEEYPDSPASVAYRSIVKRESGGSLASLSVWDFGIVPPVSFCASSSPVRQPTDSCVASPSNGLQASKRSSQTSRRRCLSDQSDHTCTPSLHLPSSSSRACRCCILTLHPAVISTAFHPFVCVFSPCISTFPFAFACGPSVTVMPARASPTTADLRSGARQQVAET